MLGKIILLIILIIINGIFSATEIAFLGIDKYYLKEKAKEENKKAKKVDKLLNDPLIFLSSIQIGITLAGFLASAFAAENFADYFIELLNPSPEKLDLTRSLLIIIITVLLSYFTLVFGELVPKKIALNNPEKIALSMAYPMNAVIILFYPFIKILSKSTDIVCKLLKVKEKDNKITEDDIKSLIRGGAYEGILENDEKKYLLNIFDFNDTKISKIMKPINETIKLNIDEDIKEIIKKIKKSKYTRFPVYKQDENNIIGILNIKHLLLNLKKQKQINLKEYLLKPLFINEEEIIDDVFNKLKEKRSGLAVVRNNKKEIIGIVTLEDIIEEILGKISDEYN